MIARHNNVQELNFSGSHIAARFVENVKDFYVQHRTIVVNPTISDLQVDEPARNIIPALSSTILTNTHIISGDGAILVEVLDTANMGNIIFEEGWSLFGDLLPKTPTKTTNELSFPKNTPLWRSSQHLVGRFKLDPWVMTRQSPLSKTTVAYSVKVNLWFAPAQTDCFIHNKHSFIEIHTQILGSGRMQKFKAQDHSTLYEDILMAPGYTTPIPFCKIEEPTKYVYPWHQYFSDNDCIWMAIEYHPETNEHGSSDPAFLNA
jgi:hypothetical protein